MCESIEWVMIAHIHIHTGMFPTFFDCPFEAADITEHASLHCAYKFPLNGGGERWPLYRSKYVLIVNDQQQQRMELTYDFTLQLSVVCSFHGHPVHKIHAICVCIRYTNNFPLYFLFKWAQNERSDYDGVQRRRWGCLLGESERGDKQNRGGKRRTPHIQFTHIWAHCVNKLVIFCECIHELEWFGFQIPCEFRALASIYLCGVWPVEHQTKRQSCVGSWFAFKLSQRPKKTRILYR